MSFIPAAIYILTCWLITYMNTSGFNAHSFTDHAYLRRHDKTLGSREAVEKLETMRLLTENKAGKMLNFTRMPPICRPMPNLCRVVGRIVPLLF